MIRPFRLARYAMLCASLSVGLGGPASATPSWILEGSTRVGTFDAHDLPVEDQRILQAALVVSGDHLGGLSGVWDRESEQALQAYAAREFDSPVARAHVASLLVTFLAELETRGWEYHYFEEYDVSVALPSRLFGMPESEDGGLRWWSDDGGLTLLLHGFAPDLAAAWHSAARAANADPDHLEAVDTDEARATSGTLQDGRAFHSKTLRGDTLAPTIYLAGEPGFEGPMALIRASFVKGKALPWDLASEGQLLAMIAQTVAGRGETGDFGEFFSRDESDGRPSELSVSSGTAFFVGPRLLLTANHVIESCRSLGLADGTKLRKIATDRDLDVAALASEQDSKTWLSLSPSGQDRLGQRLHAAGYPYYNIAGTSLHLTSGNVSSLADVNDDRRFFSFSAPVQPGNSGGPLIDRDGSVMGVVVSRLSERYIADATGTLPQNINYGLNRAELAKFLSLNDIEAEPKGLPEFAMEDGVPEGFEAAIVPVLCD
ncbi:MAG: serine protease [Pseudomonadota bacterium]